MDSSSTGATCAKFSLILIKDSTWVYQIPHLLPVSFNSLAPCKKFLIKNVAFFSVSDLNMAMSFKDALSRLENSRVKSTRPLIPPQILQEDLPL